MPVAVSTAAFAFLSQCQGMEDLTTLRSARGIWPRPSNPRLWEQVLCCYPEPADLWDKGGQGNTEQRIHHTHTHTPCPLGERTVTRESQGNGQSSAQLDKIHKLCHLFPIIGKRKNYSINHDGEMGCLGGKKLGPILYQIVKEIPGAIVRKETRKLKCLWRFRVAWDFKKTLQNLSIMNGT